MIEDIICSGWRIVNDYCRSQSAIIVSLWDSWSMYLLGIAYRVAPNNQECYVIHAADVFLSAFYKFVYAGCGYKSQ